MLLNEPFALEIMVERNSACRLITSEAKRKSLGGNSAGHEMRKVNSCN